jgi:hypothetical protein
MENVSAKDLVVGSVLSVRQGDGRWVERKIYKTSAHAVWFPGMTTSYVTRLSIDIYPNTYKIVKA